MGSAFASSTRQLEEKVRLQALVGDSDRWRPRRSGIDCVVVFCHPLWSIPQDAYLVSHSTEHTASYVVDGSKEKAENRTVGTGKNQNPESNLDFVASPVPRVCRSSVLVSSDVAGFQGVVVCESVETPIR